MKYMKTAKFHTFVCLRGFPNSAKNAKFSLQYKSANYVNRTISKCLNNKLVTSADDLLLRRVESRLRIFNAVTLACAHNQINFNYAYFPVKNR